MKVSLCPVIATTVLLLMFSCTLCSGMDASIPYEEYCHDILVEEPPQHDILPSSASSDSHLGFHKAVFSGGSPLFDINATDFSFRRSGRSAFFSTQSVQLQGEQAEGKYLVEASLLLRNQNRLWSANFNRTRVFRQGGVRRDPFLRPGGMRVTLKGFWASYSGNLCMAGCFVRNSMSLTSSESDCKVKALFHYPLVKTIHQPLMKGIIESKRDLSDPLYFEPISILGVHDAPYVFKKDDENGEIGAMVHANVPQHINVWKGDAAVCQFPWYRQPLNVAWDKHCTSQDCSPFKVVGPTTASTLLVENMVCSEGKVHSYFIFTHHQSQIKGNLLRPATDVLAAEGVWNASTGQLSALACYLEGVTNSSLAFDSRDCDIAITLQFPTTLDLTFRYSVIGKVERKEGSTLTPFNPFSFTGHMDITYGPIGWGRSPPHLEYAYTPERIMQARSQCKASRLGNSKRSKIGKRKLKYPDGQTFVDLGFQAILKDSSGSTSEAYFSPVAVDKRTNLYFNPSMAVVTTAIGSTKNRSLNISFDINFYVLGDAFKPLQNTTSHRFPAEGVYNPNKGMLCLSACRPLELLKAQSASKYYDGDKDCEMHVTVLYPPTNPGYFDKQQMSGELVSSREQNDGLFFSPVTISSGPIFYQEQAASSLAQIDFEIIMGIVSLTMAVVFIGLQLRHVRTNPKVLPHISLLTLSVLTLGHLIPLVLNFEAIFSSRTRQNVLQWSSGWLEINEVIVRLMTMVVFLMLVRLLHLSWVSKCESVGSEGPWHMEKGPFSVCLITYALAALIAMIVYGFNGSNFLDVLKGFAGLTIDFFLFPQVVGNYVWEVQGAILCFPFYLGMTFVRTLPHVYDIVRRMEFFAIRDRRFYYANPSWDFYSNAWDAVIPCGALFCAVLVFCQQKYGGKFFSLASWRQRRSYSQISMNPI